MQWRLYFLVTWVAKYSAAAAPTMARNDAEMGSELGAALCAQSAAIEPAVPRTEWEMGMVKSDRPLVDAPLLCAWAAVSG